MSFSFGSSSANMSPRGAIRDFGAEKDGRLFNSTVVMRMLSFLLPYKQKMIIAFCLMLVASALTLLTPYLIKVAIDDYIANDDGSGLLRISGYIAVSFLGLFLATIGQRYLLSWVGQRVLSKIRDTLFRHLQRLSLGYHDTHIIGVTVSRVINDVATINELLSQGLITLIGDMLVLGGVIIVMFSMSPRLALFTFSVLPLMILVTYLFSRQAKVAFRETRSTVAAIVGELAESIAGMRVIQAFSQEAETQRRFQKINAKNRQAHIRAMALSFTFLPSVEFMGILATAIVLWFGGQATMDGTVTIGIMVAFLAYVSRFFQPIQELSQLYTTMQSAMAGGEQVLKLLDTPPEVLDQPDAIEMPPIQGKVTFDDVSFAYREDTPTILHNVNLNIESGQTIALVGPTGAGKTSIANLVARFYEVSEGAVLVDDIDIRTITQESLHRQMGLVPQDPFLFPGTIADNIRFGRPDASDEAVIEAAKLANAHGFIVHIPNGYQTEILEGGVNLSIGQRQLICIARTVLADPRLLILDEATANIDTVTEGLIQTALERLLTGRTAIVIAHRLSTIRNADLICVVNDGRLVEMGSHDQLIAQDGLYRDLYERQFVQIAD